MSSARNDLIAGTTSLGIELGSTRIKAVVVGSDLAPIATGTHEWAAERSTGYWSYPLDSVWNGVQAAYKSLLRDIESRFDVRVTEFGAIGVSAMMHGYMAFDQGGALLAPFRTWQNTNTERAAQVLSEGLGINIPLRWSVAHLLQTVLDHEPHAREISYLTTLAGYVHWKLTDRRVLGIGDASGMFPIDSRTSAYDEKLLATFEAITSEHGMPWRLHDLLPTPLVAGSPAGRLSSAGAQLLDPSGGLHDGIPLAPPEGDAGTGMVATNSLTTRRANVSVGTSIFAMVVLDRQLATTNTAIDQVSTPEGRPVAMVHCNNGASDLDHWIRLLGQAAQRLGASFSDHELYGILHECALESSPDAGGVLAYNFLVGEPLVGVGQGGPILTRLPGVDLHLPDFLRAQFYSSFAALRIGMDTLTSEGVRIDQVFAHGGLFRTPRVAQRLLAAALDTPVSVSTTASEGGAWGMALLAKYLQEGGQDLAQWVSNRVFADNRPDVVEPDPQDVSGFNTYLENFRVGLPIAKATELLPGRG